MISENIFKVNYTQISSAIQSFAATDQCGKGPNFIVMSLDTLQKVEHDNLYSTNSSEILEIMGVPIAINNTLELGEIRVV